jgi:hypothetical protein
VRILVVHPGPDFSVHDVYAGWTEALRELGCEVAGYNLNDRLIFYSRALLDTGEKDEQGLPIVKQAMDADQAYLMAIQGLSHACYTMWPDVVLFVSAFFLTAGTMQLLRQRRHKLVVLHTETPYQDEEQLMRAEMADLNLLNDAVSLDKFRELGPAEYMPHAYRPRVHYPLGRAQPTPGLASDLCFIGTAFKSRVTFFEAMDLAGIDVLLGGNEWGSLPPDSPLAPFVGTPRGDADCVDNVQAAGLYRHARTGINFYRREGEDGWDERAWAMGPREVEMAACGLFYLRDPRGEGDKVLSMLPTFGDPAEASAQLRWWLAHDAERERAAILARAAIADRTFANHARRLLAMLDKRG